MKHGHGIILYLGSDLLSLIVVDSWGVDEFGEEVFGGVGVLLPNVVLSEVGENVVEVVPLLLRELFVGWTRSNVGWVGLVWGWFVVILLG